MIVNFAILAVLGWVWLLVVFIAMPRLARRRPGPMGARGMEAKTDR